MQFKKVCSEILATFWSRRGYDPARLTMGRVRTEFALGPEQANFELGLVQPGPSPVTDRSKWVRDF